MIKHECDLIDLREEALERYKDDRGTDIAKLDAEGLFRLAMNILGEDIVREQIDTWLIDRVLEVEFELLEDAAECDRAGGDA